MQTIDKIRKWTAGVTVDPVPAIKIVRLTYHLAQGSSGCFVLLAQQHRWGCIRFFPTAHTHIRMELRFGKPDLDHCVHTQLEECIRPLKLVFPARGGRIIQQITGMNLQVQRHMVRRFVRARCEYALCRCHFCLHHILAFRSFVLNQVES